jgi:hypothetical protein
MTGNSIFHPPEEMRELNLLQELEKNPTVSQRELSHKFGIALGVTNACLKRMARRGWIRITGMNQRQISYYLTPSGIAEKSKLAFRLITWTVQHYSALKRSIERTLLEMQNAGVKRLAFYGVSDEMEVAYITLQGVNLKLVGIVEDDESFTSNILFGYELEPVSRIGELKPDGILITSLTGQDDKAERAKKLLGATSVCIRVICLS